MINWLRKQWFYIVYFLCGRNPIVNGIPNFESYDFADDQWESDPVGMLRTKDYTQTYGTVVYKAVLNGEFKESIWPCIWLVYIGAGCYYEIDIELMQGKKRPYLVFTVWINPESGTPIAVKRIGFRKKSFINKLRTETHEFTIVWDDKKVKYYINNILSGVIKGDVSEPMNIMAGNVEMEFIKAYKR